MRIGDFPLVSRTIAARAALVDRRDNGDFAVYINSDKQDAEMAEACRPVVIATLEARIAELDKDLEQLGVRIS